MQDVLRTASCPSVKVLQEWLDGSTELPETELNHVGTCAHCVETLAYLSNDRGLQKIYESTSARSKILYYDEPEFEKVKASLRHLPHVLSQVSKSSEHMADLLESTQREGHASTDNDSVALDSPSIESLARRLPPGQFIVERLIAQGGTGAVFLAYDPRLQREVAIKVLSRDSFRDRQRFLREARILADLQHPNIVRIFDCGTLASDSEIHTKDGSIDQNGPLYLVMEYVAGGSLVSIPTNAMNLREWAALLATAADGLSAAHARTLVHRDVKPGNLLLTEDRRSLKVGDFGLARLLDTDATQVTRTGDVLGTPVFMSPEQVAAPESIDASSDVYSLGATLYQIITGVPPFQGGAAAVIRQVVERSPVAPRWINSSIPADLETICMHAMQHEAKSRYSTMQEFAADLRRFADGEPILARPTTSITKAVRWLKRNKSFSAILAICVALAFLLTVGSLVAASQFYRQAKRLEVAVDNERASKHSAEEALKASITAADELLLAVTEETELLPRAPGSQAVTRKLLLKAKDYFRKFLHSNRDNPTLKYQLARAHAGLATVAIRVGDKAAMEEETQAALAMIASLSDDAISPEERASLQSDTILAFANYLIESGEPKRAVSMLEEAKTLCESVLQRLTSPPSKELQSSHALAILGLANALHWIGKNDDATPLLHSAKEKLVKLASESLAEHSFLRSAAACDMTLATIALNQNQASIGKSHLQNALDLLNQVRDEDAISLRIRELKIKVFTNLALADRRMGNNEEAKAGYESAITESKRLIELEPSVPSHQWNLVVASLNLGGPEMELGNLDSLVERWQGTVPVLDRLIEGEPENQRYQQVKAMLQSNIAIVLRDMGKLEEAIVPLRAATVTLLEQAKRVEYASSAYLPVALNHHELASTWLQMGRLEEAGAALDESDTIVKEILERESTFAPAKGHWIDALHTRISLLIKQGEKTLERRQKIAAQSVELAKELAATSPDVAEYQLKVPRALIDQAEGWLDGGQSTESVSVVLESKRLLSEFQETLKAPSPEVRILRKNALLVEAKGWLASTPKSEERDSRFRDIVAEAEASGASPEEVSALLSLVE